MSDHYDKRVKQVLKTKKIMITFDEPIHYGRLVKRYKRFFMDIELESGELVVAHTPNTGSMMGLLKEKNLVMLSENSNPKRKTRFTTQAIKVNGSMVGVNTHLPNKLVRVSLGDEIFNFLHSYQNIAAEVPYGPGLRSRIDLKLSNCTQGRPDFFLEIKNVTLKINDSARFPDAVSVRAQKHIKDLLFMQEAGYLSALFFIVQRQDCQYFTPAKEIDETYANMLHHAKNNGLIIKAFATQISSKGVKITHEMPLKI